MNEHKICFIICTNNTQKLESCLEHISKLDVPDGFETQIITIKDASSMFEGYQRAMEQSDAKYKIYLHQDVDLLYSKMLFEMLSIFTVHPEIGLLGVAGYKYMPQNAIMWECTEKYGKLYEARIPNNGLLYFKDVNNDSEDVKIVDGLLLITQYDIPWRKDIFNGWHFYDASCCMEFLKSGYHIAIPRQEQVWCFHNCDMKPSMKNYDETRAVFLEEYNKKPMEKILAAIENQDSVTANTLIDSYLNVWSPNDDIAIYRGEELLLNGQLHEAINIIRSGLSYNSSNYELYFMLGEAYEYLKNNCAAELCYRYSIYQCHQKEDLPFLEQNLERFIQANGKILPKLSILLRVSQNSDWLKLFLQMILLYTVPDRFEVLFVEENPSQELHKLLMEQTLGTVIPNDETNSGSSYNLALELTDKNSDIVIIEEGGLPLEHTFFTLQLLLYQSYEIGCTGSISNQPSCSKYMVTSCPTVSDAMAYAHKHNIPDSEPPVSSFELPGPIYMIKRSFIKRYGWFDTEFKSCYCQIRDYLFRIINNGKKVLICPNSFSLQIPSPSPKWIGEEIEHFKEKWGVNLTYSCHAREDLLSMVKMDSLSPYTPFKVLEIGCACGAILIEFKRRFPNSSLYGIELDEKPASIASHFAKISNENIENSSLSYPKNFFDFIILGDVLEHLREPDKVLETIKDYLTEDGMILASIPNVMHISVIKPLLSGFWTYKSAGILDQTHLRFFYIQ